MRVLLDTHTLTKLVPRICLGINRWRLCYLLSRGRASVGLQVEAGNEWYLKSNGTPLERHYELEAQI